MLSTLAPSVRITIRPTNSTKALLVEAENLPSISIGSEESLRRLLQDQTNFRTRLESFKLHGAISGELPWAKAEAALRELRSLSIMVVDRLLDADYAALPKLQSLFERAFEAPRRANLPPIVQITSPQSDVVLNSIPFELLPVQTPPRDEKVADHLALGMALDRYLGFSAIIARDFGPVGAGTVFSLRSGRLPIKVFWNSTLKNAESEVKFFASRLETFEIEGPWPTESSFAVDRTGIVEQQILFPSLRLDGSSREPPDQIQHFVCHCDTFGPSPDYSFTLGLDSKQHSVSLANLHDWQIDAASKGGLSNCEMPLVFLNACGGAAMDPQQVGSFVRFFLNNKNRGFIGTMTLIPDMFASKFAELFYIGLARDRITVGEAIYRSRRTLAKVYRNPLGILYMHFGRSELRLQG